MGEFVAIVGPTGAENRRCSMSAAGLLKPASGTVRIFDASLFGLTGRTGYLFQADMRCSWKTAIDNVAIGSRYQARRAASAGTGAGLVNAWVSAGSAIAIRICCRAGSASALALRKCDPRSQDPADGRTVRAARTPSPADHWAICCWNVERRPQGGAVRHHDLEDSDRARRPRRDHVGGAPAARIIGDWGAAAAPGATF